MVPLDQPLGERTGVLLGAARDLLAVALHHVEDAHQTTSPIASSIATLASTSVSSRRRRRPAADEVAAQVDVGDDAVDRLRRPARRRPTPGAGAPPSPTVSGIAAHARATHRHVERHRLEQRDAESFVLADRHERDRAAEHRREPGVVDRADDVHLREVELADLRADRVGVAREAVLADEQERAPAIPK